MRNRIQGAAFAACIIALLSSSAFADIVDITDGKKGIRLPRRSDIKTPWGEMPTDEELRKSGRKNLELAYDAFVIGRTRGDAAQVVYVYITEALMNTNFNNGERYGVSGFWPEAAEAFGAAAEELTGAAKQLALYQRMEATANTDDATATMKAANELLASDTKTYYFGPAQEMRAKILARNRQWAQAVASLQKVADAPGMNGRDLFSAKYLALWLTKTVGADSAEKWAAAEKAYRDLLTEIDRHERRELAEIPRFKTLMSLGEAIRSQGRDEEAKKLLEEVLRASTDATDKGVLAGVYYGLGDVAFQRAMRTQKKGSSPAVRKQVEAFLNEAALHYLRVVLLYSDFAGQRELFGATQGVAKTFDSLFTIGGEKDCDMARRSYDFYRKAVQMQERGEARRILVRQGKALKQRIDELCGKKDDDSPLPDETDPDQEKDDEKDK